MNNNNCMNNCLQQAQDSRATIEWLYKFFSVASTKNHWYNLAPATAIQNIWMNFQCPFNIK